MTHCPVSGLPITEKEHWSFEQRQGNYIRKYSLIGSDILHVQEVAEHPIVPEHLYAADFQSLISEENLTDLPLYLMLDCTPVSDLSRSYKKEFTNLLLDQQSPIRLIVLYNTSPAVQLQFELFTNLENTEHPIILAETYDQAVNSILEFKSGNLVNSTIKPGLGSLEDPSLIREFLTETATMLLLGNYDRELIFPSENHHAHIYFRLLDLIRRDLKAMEEEHQQKAEQIEQEFRALLASKNTLLDLQVEQNKKNEQRFKEKETALLSRAAAQELETTRISTANAEKNVVLRSICDLLESIDLDPAVREELSSRCSALFKTSSTASLINTELTETDSAFISRLQKKHPSLNQRELRISLLIKLDYHSRDIARTLGLSTRGIESIRYRLHKKIGLNRHRSLKTYFTDLAGEQV